MITIISGARNSGKTRLIQERFEKYGGRGYCQPRVLDREGKAVGYNICFMETGEERALARREELRPEEWKSWSVVGQERFCFASDIFDELVKRALKEWKGNKAVFIDEFGILEADRKGYWPLIEKFAPQPEAQLFITCRPKLLDNLINMLKDLGIKPDKITLKKI